MSESTTTERERLASARLAVGGLGGFYWAFGDMLIWPEQAQTLDGPSARLSDGAAPICRPLGSILWLLDSVPRH